MKRFGVTILVAFIIALMAHILSEFLEVTKRNQNTNKQPASEKSNAIKGTPKS
jgi:uncharacterized alpha/beta hydrolase family protein